MSAVLMGSMSCAMSLNFSHEIEQAPCHQLTRAMQVLGPSPRSAISKRSPGPDHPPAPPARGGRGGVIMMCAPAVPGNMIHGSVDDALVESPVVSVVANGV